MHFHAEMSAELAAAADKAGRLREEARKLLIEAAADAKQAGMTQREIATALDRSQPEVSRLLKLAPPIFQAKSQLGALLVEKKRQVLEVVASQGCENVRVFGSLARGEDTPESDIDLLVDIPDDFSLFDLGGLQVDIQDLFDVHVDVIPARGLKGDIRSTALRDAVRL